jgi:hypothetical protein
MGSISGAAIKTVTPLNSHQPEYDEGSHVTELEHSGGGADIPELGMQITG